MLEREHLVVEHLGQVGLTQLGDAGRKALRARSPGEVIGEVLDALASERERLTGFVETSEITQHVRRSGLHGRDARALRCGADEQVDELIGTALKHSDQKELRRIAGECAG
ncbi:MAG: hypothetical protein IPQ14_02750 [Candidatus Microthrix sp.]|uniref:hypothetical protein n=1 Tax=Candidatus Neomicrothrix sp. TaxID=2719034 RepID=UPI002A79B3A8|nr:hypothetical protein [Candidatus Microthrix sp.]